MLQAWLKIAKQYNSKSLTVSLFLTGEDILTAWLVKENPSHSSFANLVLENYIYI